MITCNPETVRGKRFNSCFEASVLYIHYLYMREAKALARLRVCAYAQARLSLRGSPIRKVAKFHVSQNI